MKKISSGFLVVILLTSLLHYAPVLEPCSTFCLKSGKSLVFGRNYDWDTGVGFVMVNKRSLVKKALNFFNPSSKQAQWVSKYGSITFNQYGRENPMGGMNEAGLVVEVMWLSETQYPVRDERLSLGELEWVQYQLDNFASVSEVIESNSSIRITTNSKPIHFLVCDSSGQAAAIEFLDGKMVCHTAETLPVKALTNSTYDESIEYLKAHKGFGGEREISLSGNSLDRFVRAANMLRSYKKEKGKQITDYAFSVLENVSSRSRTQWSIVYDIANKEVHFKTKDFPQTKRFAFKDFDFLCMKPSMVIDMNEERSGDIRSLFIPYTAEINRKLIGESFRNTEFLKDIPEEILDQLAKYPESFICKEKKK
jgi:choloylglycine hydrolase